MQVRTKMRLWMKTRVWMDQEWREKRKVWQKREVTVWVWQERGETAVYRWRQRCGRARARARAVAQMGEGRDVTVGGTKVEVGNDSSAGERADGRANSAGVKDREETAMLQGSTKHVKSAPRNCIHPVNQ
jgi:hypothetical protein